MPHSGRLDADGVIVVALGNNRHLRLCTEVITIWDVHTHRRTLYYALVLSQRVAVVVDDARLRRPHGKLQRREHKNVAHLACCYASLGVVHLPRLDGEVFANERQLRLEFMGVV